MSDTADLVVTGGPIVTLDRERPAAEAVLIRDGRIELVGDLRTVRTEARGAEVMDLAGATALPGFVDAHSHIELSSISLECLISAHVPPCRSLREVAAVIDEQKGSQTSSHWLVCRSSFGLQEKVVEGRLFHRRELDAISPDRPLAVFAGLHVGMLNTAGLRELGLLDREPPRGSTLHRDPDGQPNGVVTEVFHLLPSWPATEIARALSRHHVDLLLAHGITTVSSIPFSQEELSAVQGLIRGGELGTRFRHYPAVPWAFSPDHLDRVRGSAPDLGDRYQVLGVKVFVDGQGGDGLDAQFDDLKYDQGDLDDLVGAADEADLQVIMHAVTTTGIRMAARSIGAADRRQGRSPSDNPLRHRIEHGADYADTQDIALLRASGALLVTTPHFIRSESGASTPPAALRTLLDAGLPIAGGTDTTGTVPEGASPLYNVWCASAPRPLSRDRDQRLDRVEALSLFTSWAAEAAAGRPDRGRLRPRMLGDLAVLSQNPLDVPTDRLPDITVDASIVGGKVAYRR
jgi:predicted amidohydrolase YtcJ